MRVESSRLVGSGSSMGLRGARVRLSDILSECLLDGYEVDRCWRWSVCMYVVLCDFVLYNDEPKTRGSCSYNYSYI